MTVLYSLRISRTPVLGLMVIGFYWGSFAASVPDIKAGLGIDDAAFGLILLLNAVGLVTAMSLAPRIRRLLGERALQAAFLAMVVLFPLASIVPFVWMFGVVMLCTGFASGLLDVLVNTRVAELEAETNQSLMNANHAMFSVAYAMSALTMGGVRDFGGIPVIGFCIWAVVTCALIALVRLPVPITSQGNTPPKAQFTPAIMICGGIVLIAFMTEATVETWSALHIERTLHGNPAEGALGPAMLGITMAIGRFSGATLSARFTELQIITVATAISVIGCGTAAIAPTPVVAYLGFGILGLGISVIGPIGLALVGQNATDETRSAAISQAAIVGFSGFFLAPAVMGLLADGYGLRVAYGVFAVILLLLYPLIAWLRR